MYHQDTIYMGISAYMWNSIQILLNIPRETTGVHFYPTRNKWKQFYSRQSWKEKQNVLPYATFHKRISQHFYLSCENVSIRLGQIILRHKRLIFFQCERLCLRQIQAFSLHSMVTYVSIVKFNYILPLGSYTKSFFLC